VLGPVAAPTVGRLLSAGFSYQMLKGAVDQYPQLKEAISSGDYGQAAETLTKMGLGTGMAALGVKHAAGDVYGEDIGKVTPEEGTRLLATPETQSENIPIPPDGSAVIPAPPDGSAVIPAKPEAAPVFQREAPAVSDDAVTPGPGAQNFGAGDPVTLDQIGKSMRASAPDAPSVADRVSAALDNPVAKI